MAGLIQVPPSSPGKSSPEPDIKHTVSREWVWDNGSVLCDKFLKHHSCSRTPCGRQHRLPYYGETRPLCYNFFTLRDKCLDGVQCPLSHVRGNVVTHQEPENRYIQGHRKRFQNKPHNEDLLASLTINYPSGASEAKIAIYQPVVESNFRMLEEKTEPEFKNEIPKPEEAKAALCVSKVNPVARMQRESMPLYQPPKRQSSGVKLNHGGRPLSSSPGGGSDVLRTSDGPTVSKPYVAAPYKQSQPFKKQSRPNCHGGIKPEQTSIEKKDCVQLQVNSGPRMEPIPPHQSMSAKPGIGNCPASEMQLDCKRKPVPNLERQPESLKGTAHSQSHRYNLSSLKHPTNNITPPFPLTTQFSKDSRQISCSKSDMRGIIFGPDSSPLGGVPLRSPSPTSGSESGSGESTGDSISSTSEEPKTPVRSYGTSTSSHDCNHTCNSIAPLDKVRPDSRANAISKVPANNQSDFFGPHIHPTNLNNMEILTHGPSKQTGHQKLSYYQAEEPEWELMRCFNCWEEGHYPAVCTERHLFPQQREALRDKKGRINRLWTDNYILRDYAHLFPEDIITKHLGFQNIWTPHVSYKSGIWVTPAAFKYRYNPRNVSCSVQTDKEEKPPMQDTFTEVDSPSMVDQASQTLDNKSRWFKKSKKASANNTASVISGRNHQPCAICDISHSLSTPCHVEQHGQNVTWDAEVKRQERDCKTVAMFVTTTGVSRKTPKQRMRKDRPLCLSASRLVQEFPITTYRIEDVESGERETAFERGDLKLLDELKVEAESAIEIRLQDGNQKAAFIKCPNEVLEDILTYVADDYIPHRKQKIKDMAAGHGFFTDPQLNRHQAVNLAGVAKSCRKLRLIAQSILYRVVCFDNFISIRNFVRTVVADPVLGKMVHAVYINLEQTRTSQLPRNRGLFRYQQDYRGVVAHLDLASVFVALVESCPGIQVLSVKMFGSLIGFGALRGSFQNMREICIADHVSMGQVLNNIWNQLINFPRLTKLKIVHSEYNDAVNFDPLQIPYHMASKAFNHIFNTLQILTLQHAPEISDDLLVRLVGRLPALKKLAIVDCKLVTSTGIADALERIPDQLTMLIYWVWLNYDGKPHRNELEPSGSHLCSALALYGSKLETIRLKPYTICAEMWLESNFKRLNKCTIEMGQYCPCQPGQTEISFHEAYNDCRTENRVPSLMDAIFHLHTVGVSYR